MVLVSDIPLPASDINERYSLGRNPHDVMSETQQRIAGVGHTSRNIAHPSFHDLLRRGLPIALRWDKCNIDQLIPGKSIAVELGKSALATFFVDKKSPIHPQHLTTKVDHNSYFIKKDDPSHTLLNTRKYWQDGMREEDCIFLSMNAIVDAKKDGQSTVNAVRRKIIHGMNMIMLAGTLSHCSPEQNHASYESNYISYESGIQSDTYTVQEGDTLSGICRLYGNIFTVSDLKAINHINDNIIYIDQVLTLPQTQYFQEIQQTPVIAAIPVSQASFMSSADNHSKISGKPVGNMAQIGQTNAENFIQMARAYDGYNYHIGGTGSTPEAGIDCSQLIVNALIGTGCIPEGSDTNTKTLQKMCQKIGNREGQPGDFLIMGGSVPHIAIITENLGGGRYTTFDASPRQKKVCENTRVAGKSYAVYRNPFILGNQEISQPESEPEEQKITLSEPTTKTKNLAECSIRGPYHKQVLRATKIIRDNQDKYEEVERATGVPWQIIAAIHYREGSLNFKTVLHNGEEIIGTDLKTKKVPAGHGPFETWAEGAIDALKTHYVACPLDSVSLDNTVLLRAAQYMKTFNGAGYDKAKGGNPYLYAGLVSPEGNQYYTTGLYTRDKSYSIKTVDKRPGTIPILLDLLGAGHITEDSIIAENVSEMKSKDSAGNIHFTTYIRSIPVKTRQAFLREYGADFDINFRNNYTGTAAQNNVITGLLKRNHDFREKWETQLLGGENHGREVASN